MPPHLLTRLGRVIDTTHREITLGKRTEVHEVGPDVCALPAGTVVLVAGAGPPWLRAHRVNLQGWPAGVPGLSAIWATRVRLERHRLSTHVPIHGLWVLDERGLPCEIGEGAEDGPVRFVLNYGGWRLSDLAHESIEVTVCESDVGTVWIVPPQPPPVPPEASPAPPAWRPPPQPRAAPPPPEPPRPIPFQRHLSVAALEFGDGFVSWMDGTRWVTLPSPHAREIYTPIREALAVAMPRGVEVEGIEHPDGAIDATVFGLEAVESIFERVRRDEALRAVCASEEWVDADALAAHLAADPIRLLDVDELGFGKRREAWRRLFAHRDPAEAIRLLARRAVIVPLPATDGGPRWYAWEALVQSNATYLFRPGSAAQADAMLRWTEPPDVRRRDLLRDPTLQSELGYVTRVIHHDLHGEALGRWWEALSERVGLRTPRVAS